ncbi:MAG: flavin reductase [Lachnospiraceae bacterium]|nr:flavin reductase [Lachnospiraceae bacterium]
MNKEALYKLSYGLFVLTACQNEKDNGCIINTATQLSSNPNRISIAVNKNNFTHDMISETRKFTLSVISEEAEFELIKRFGFQSGRDADKFAGFEGFRRGANGAAIITEGTNAYLSAWVEQCIDVGTHTLFIAQMTDADVLSGVPSATYQYYQDHIKPVKAGKTSDGKTIWRCRICGYEYVGDELPQDFICPICKHPAEDFEKIKA